MKNLLNHYKITEGACMGCQEPCKKITCRYHIHGDAREDQIASAPTPLVTCTIKLANRGGLTLEEIGNTLGVTRERVRQIERKAVEKLDRSLRRIGYTPDMLLYR